MFTDQACTGHGDVLVLAVGHPSPYRARDLDL